jgi:hypothetical protein
MVRVGPSLLLNRGNTAWLYSNGVTGSPRDLGRSDGVFPGPNRNQAWVWSQPCRPPTGCANYNAAQMGSVHLVDRSGTHIGPPVQLPGGAGWYPTGIASTAGIVLSELPAYGDHRGTEELWNPLTDRVVRVFPRAFVIGAASDLVVSESPRYCGSELAPCSVRVANLATGSDRKVVLPKGVVVDGGAAISPNLRTIALTAALSETRHAPSRVPYPEVIVLIHTHTGHATVLPGSQQMTNPSWGPMSLTWSTNGWLFSDTVGTSLVRAWHPGQRGASVLPRVRLPKFQLVNEDPSLIAM